MCLLRGTSWISIIRVYFHLYAWSQSLWNFWCREWHWNRFFTESVSFPCQYYSTSASHSSSCTHYIHTYTYSFTDPSSTQNGLNVALMRRANGRSLGTLQKAVHLRKSEIIGQKCIFNLLIFKG